MEILAPAGNPESLERAWAAGADAVYLGYSAFSARAGAGNFDGDQLKEAIRFAHLHRMRVYVTVNTLVKDGELAGLRELLGMLRELRPDGVLVQDAGILRIARREYPELPLHASTQMAIHHPAGVRWCRRMGFRRVVLARECSLEEIRRCAEEGVEIEVFCHGAQCVAVSGLCLFSSMVGGRSGNRGRCAQPCRMVYRFDGREGTWLSPRDVCLRDDLPALAEAGVASLKIEGRLKRPEYVAAVTASYRRALDAGNRGEFHPAEEGEREALRQIFSRGDFMRGYAFDTQDAGFIRPDGAGHLGVEIGRVEAESGGMARVRLSRDLHDGDGIRIGSPRPDSRDTGDMVYAGHDAERGGIALIRLRSGLRAREGDPVFRLTDVRQLGEAMALRGRGIPVNMHLRALPGEKLTLEADDGESRVMVEGNPVEKALNRPAGEAELAARLGKTGGTAFEAGRIRVETEGAFVPVSEINALRRRALELLAEKRIRAWEEELSPAPAPQERGGDRPPAPRRLPEVIVRTEEQAWAARQAGLCPAWYPEDFRAEAMERLSFLLEEGDWLRLPDVCPEETLERLRDWAEARKDVLGGIVLGTIGQLGLSWPLPFGAGSGIPVMNREAAEMLREEGCAFITASPELTEEELRELLEGLRNLPVIVPVYGRTQLMLLHHCPARTALGLRAGRVGCDLCDRGDPRSLGGKVLTDRKGYRFPLERQRLEGGCLVRLLNALPLDNMDMPLGAEKGKQDAARVLRGVELTEENGGEAAEILKCLGRFERAPGESTRGHWRRPTE